MAGHGVTGEKSHGDWRSVLLDTGNGHLARAMTVRSTVSGEISTMYLDSVEGDCDSVLMSVNFSLSRVPETDIETPVLFGKFRIDGNPVHDINYGYEMERGQDFIKLSFPKRPRNDAIIDEITNGTTARFQFKINGGTLYYEFSLNGSSGALNRAARLCSGALQADELYIKQAVPGIDSYFRD